MELTQGGTADLEKCVCTGTRAERTEVDIWEVAWVSLVALVVVWWSLVALLCCMAVFFVACDQLVVLRVALLWLVVVPAACVLGCLVGRLVSVRRECWYLMVLCCPSSSCSIVLYGSVGV